MKKNTFYLYALLIGFVFAFSSCDDDEEDPAVPTISVSFSLPASSATIGESVTIQANAVADARIEQIILEVQGPADNAFSIIDTKDDNFTNNTSDIYVYTWDTSTSIAGAYEFRITLTDRSSGTAQATTTFTLEADETPLADAAAFEFVRVGSNDGTGLDQFGLTWEENTSEVAIIKKGADKLVVLTAADWTDITTKEGLAAAVTAGTDVADYRGISVVEANQDYTGEVIATQVGENYFILNFERSSVSTGDAGTTVTINGEYKN